ncbi:hypothetical protein PoB_007640600 [Plakobranchus ocellatus]|uniref:Uncharacterized protein n=1 Tax=Plakobranchus ocellatus TaxID=259542 RepID=A0AAV4E1F6_9GAST|nr:hypothetical protein PoB_007640600 [Plakobranchus ocellatus]
MYSWSVGPASRRSSGGLQVASTRFVSYGVRKPGRNTARQALAWNQQGEQEEEEDHVDGGDTIGRGYNYIRMESFCRWPVVRCVRRKAGDDDSSLLRESLKLHYKM